MATSKKQKKQSTSLIDAVNRWADRNFRNSINKSSSDLNKKIQKKLDPVRKEAKKVNTKIQKEYGDPLRKKASNLNTKIQTKVGDPIRKSTYGDKKKEVKKVEVKKPAVKPNNKDLLDKMTRTAQGYYLNTKTGKLEKNPDINTITKKFAEDLKNKQTKKVEVKKPTAKPISMKTPVRVSDIANKVAEGAGKKDAPKVKAQIESLIRPEIKKKKEKVKKKVLQPEIKRYKPNTEPLRYLDDKLPIKNSESKKSTPTPPPTPPPPASSPTVSQLWQQKTGTSWSEAKKQGLTDGSASANMALMKKLKSGEINKSSLSKPKTEVTPTPVATTPTPTPTPKSKPTPYAGSGIGAMERSEREFEEQGFRRGGSVRKMRKGGMVKRKK